MSAASDGILKVWSMQAAACKFTADAHADRVWALAVPKTRDAADQGGEESSSPRVVAVSGGADGTIRVWRDHTS